MFLCYFCLLNTFAIDDALCFPALSTSPSKYLCITAKLLTENKNYLGQPLFTEKKAIQFKK